MCPRISWELVAESLGIRGVHFGDQWPILLNQVTGFKYFMTMHSLLLHCKNNTNECIWSYANLLRYNCREPFTCFGHVLWPSSGQLLYEAYITKTCFCNMSFWPRQVYDNYIIVNSHNFIYIYIISYTFVGCILIGNYGRPRSPASIFKIY